MTQATHLEAVQALLQATNEVVLVVRHEPQPAGLRVCIREKLVSRTLLTISVM